MKLFRHTKRKSILERKLTLMNQIHQIQRELVNMERQCNMTYAHASVQAAEDMG